MSPSSYSAIYVGAEKIGINGHKKPEIHGWKSGFCV